MKGKVSVQFSARFFFSELPENTILVIFCLENSRIFSAIQDFGLSHSRYFYGNCFKAGGGGL